MRIRSSLVIVVVAVLATLAVVVWRTGTPATPPVFEAPTVVVLSPHPDDETFGAALTIQAQLAAGRRVVAVLLTDGENSVRIEKWVRESGEDLNGDGVIDRWDFATARRAEFEHAVSTLGVRELRFLGRLDSRGESGLEDKELRVADVEQALEALSADIGEGVAYLAPMGYLADDPVRGDFMGHPDHAALFEAVSALAGREEREAVYFKVYEYEAPESARQAPLRVRGDAEMMRLKRAAIDAYGEAARVSTPEIWEGARSDPHEYLVRQADL